MTATFDAERELAGLEEPVRRYLAHALAPGAALPARAEVEMRGRIDPGMPMRFTAWQRFDGHAFRWEAAAGWGPFRPLRVVDSYDGRGRGGTEGRAFGRLRFLHADDADSGRTAAGRAAAESIWRPWLLLPSAGVRWRLEAADAIVAAFEVPPEAVELHLRLRGDGSVSSLHLRRWGNVGQDHYGYIPFGGDVLAESTFGGWTGADTSAGGVVARDAEVQAVLRRHCARRPPGVTAGLDLYWIPLGAGGHSVRLNGKAYEALAALRQRRSPAPLYHAALVAGLGAELWTIELAPSPDNRPWDRGVVATGAVGSAWLGRWRLFRYEVRCWQDGTIPDLAEAVGGPQRLTDDMDAVGATVAAVARVPTPVWGRDELRAGEGWNSNSMVAWVLRRAGLDAAALTPPGGGRAPGWGAGVVVADREDP